MAGRALLVNSFLLCLMVAHTAAFFIPHFPVFPVTRFVRRQDPPTRRFPDAAAMQLVLQDARIEQLKKLRQNNNPLHIIQAGDLDDNTFRAATALRSGVTLLNTYDPLAAGSNAVTIVGDGDNGNILLSQQGHGTVAGLNLNGLPQIIPVEG